MHTKKTVKRDLIKRQNKSPETNCEREGKKDREREREVNYLMEF